MPPRLSVILCCHNSASRLPPTLAALGRQGPLPDHATWEIILVDNASTDYTVAVGPAHWSRADVPLQVVSAPTPGLSHARHAGLAAAQGEIIVLVDDDNHLAPGYLAAVVQAFATDPALGVVGGHGRPVADDPLPPWFAEVQSFYACGPEPAAPRAMEAVVGAGLALRRVAWDRLQAAGFISQLQDRTGQQLTSGGDVELCLALRLQGWQIQQRPELAFDHWMPAGRLTPDYARRLVRGMAASFLTLATYRAVLHRQPPPALHPLALLGRASLRTFKAGLWAARAKLSGRLRPALLAHSNLALAALEVHLACHPRARQPLHQTLHLAQQLRHDGAHARQPAADE